MEVSCSVQCANDLVLRDVSTRVCLGTRFARESDATAFVVGTEWKDLVFVFFVEFAR